MQICFMQEKEGVYNPLMLPLLIHTNNNNNNNNNDKHGGCATLPISVSFAVLHLYEEWSMHQTPVCKERVPLC